MSERDLEKLFAIVLRAVERGYITINDWMRAMNPLHAIEERIIRGEFPIVGTDDAARALATELQAQYAAGGQQSAKWLDAKVTDSIIRFDTASRSVVARAEQNQLELVYGFREEQNKIARQIVQRSLVEGAQSGENPRRVAQDFRDAIGLTPTQEQHVANYRRQLRQQDYTAALARELSDGRSDRTIRSARDKARPLTQAEEDTAVERYRANYITHRAETIARTDGLGNVAAGANDAIDQAIRRGDVEAGVLIKTWHARGGIRGREMHTQMDGVVVRWGEDFVLPDGTRMSHPHDPRGGAEHNANCGCTASTSYDLSRLSSAA